MYTANDKNTTLKSTMLSYREVGSGDGVIYTKLGGVLRGLTISQDEPESTSIDAEFFDSPFYIEYTASSVTINFELANYSLAELHDLLGGTTTAATESAKEKYEAPTSLTSIEKEWKLEFGTGYKSLIIYKGALVATLKKDEDGALNYACTISSLIHNNGTAQSPSYRIYSIVGDTTGSSSGG